MTMIISEIKDENGRIIYLTDERYNHILKHPEMSNRLEEIKDFLINPNIVVESKTDKNVNVYYKYNKDRIKYLLVAVKYLNGKGFIITSFYTDKIK